MSIKTYPVWEEKQYLKAGAYDLIELRPVPGSNPIFLQKNKLDAFVQGISNHAFIHVSGPTGSAKTSLIESITYVPENFECICKALGFEVKPIKIFGTELALFETPGEIYQRRSLIDGSTIDEASIIVQALKNFVNDTDNCYPVMWIREMGRVHSSSVQGGLCDLITKGTIPLPDGTLLDAGGICWIADSNYQAEDDSVHTLVTFDDALKRRFTHNITLSYLEPELEAAVLKRILKKQGNLPKDLETIRKVVKLGYLIRQSRANGKLTSLVPPTIYGYLSFIKMANTLKNYGLQQIAFSTLLGNASNEDQKVLSGLFNEAFGLQVEEDEEMPLFENYF